MNGSQSFLLNEIKQEIRAGRNVSHILNVKISNEVDNALGTRIRVAIFNRIANQAIAKDVEGEQVIIKWKTSARTTSAYYYCDSPFTNRTVIKHAKTLLRDILNETDDDFGNNFTNQITGLAFLVSLPAIYVSPNPNDVII
jgi:hypothetical protein